MADGTLLFDTGIDNSGFKDGVGSLNLAAASAIGNIAANIVTGISEAFAQIPQQMVAVGSSFEAAMSQVAATSAISNVSDEFVNLSEAAKEMGAATQFSASQAAEALNYLGQAGYDAATSIESLPQVLTLASSGGMALGQSASLLTDSMAALGLGIDDLDVFIDQLAVAAQKSNTDVALLGESILTVGGTAKVLAGGITEMNTVLGVLADNGIKGAEGGTALRNMILSLSAPTDTAKSAIDNLGISVFDAYENMRALPDIIGDLNTSLSSMTQAEQTNTLSNIFNKVDLKSVNALLGTSSARFESLSNDIENSAGAADQMSKTMNDNLKGDIVTMQSGLEGLGIAAYEKFQVPMRTAVQDITEAVSELTVSLTDGELSDSFDSLSDTFGKLASSAIVNFTENILPELITGTEKAINTFNQFKPVIVGVTAAIIAYKAVVLIANVATQAAWALQIAFNLACSANPVLLLVSAIGLLAGAMATYNGQMDEIHAAFERGTSVYQEQIDSIDELQKSYDSVKKSAQDKINAQDKEIDELSSLKKKLDEHVDANGQIIGDYEIVKSLISEINELYPESIDLIGNQIQGYNDLTASIDEYIETQRKQIRLDAKKEVWKESIYVYDELSIENDQLLKNAQAADEAYIKARKAYDKYHGGPNNFTPEIKSNAEEAGLSIAEYLRGQYEETRGVWQSAHEAYGKSQKLMSEAAEKMAVIEEDIKQSSGVSSNSAVSNITSSAEMNARDSAAKIAIINKETAEKIAESQDGILKDIADGWKSAEHNYAIGLTSEAEMLAEKQRIWDTYGDESQVEHWQYYEDLYNIEKQYYDDSQQLYEDDIKNKWKAIDNSQNLGLISEEEAYKKRLDFIQQYCPEYSDEWYDYYKTVYDYQQESESEQLDTIKEYLNEQVDAVEDSIDDIVKAYKSAYSDLQSDMDSYKAKLLSVGDAFSIIENEDENGDKTKTFQVNDLQEQMAEMQKYHAYIKQLKEQGASSGILNELSSMDFEDSSYFAQNLANMSAEEFKQINDYYTERDAMASELAADLYAPEMEQLNNQLTADITAQFGTLPADIQALGAESIEAFIAGLTSGDMSEQVELFVDNFFTACEDGIDNGFTNLDLSDSFAALMEQDTYTMGQDMGSDFVNGFMERIGEMYAAVAIEQSNISAEYTAGNSTKPTNETTLSDSKTERIVIENHIHAQLDVDGEKMAETVIQKTNDINRRKGK